jgi:hypothetical protein
MHRALGPYRCPWTSAMGRGRDYQNSAHPTNAKRSPIGLTINRFAGRRPFWISGRHSIRDRSISARSPWQSGSAEKLIGGIRRECLDPRRRIRGSNIFAICSGRTTSRTRLSLAEDAPILHDLQLVRRVLALPILGRLRRRYVRVRNFRQG